MANKQLTESFNIRKANELDWEFLQGELIKKGISLAALMNSIALPLASSLQEQRKDNLDTYELNLGIIKIH